MAFSEAAGSRRQANCSGKFRSHDTVDDNMHLSGPTSSPHTDHRRDGTHEPEVGKLILPRYLRRGKAAFGLFALGFVLVWLFRLPIFGWLVAPLVHAASLRGVAQPSLNITSPSELFFSFVQLAALGGLLAAAPLITLQVATWVAPRCSARANPAVRLVLLPACLALIAGLLLAHFVVFPAALTRLYQASGSTAYGPLTLRVGDFLQLVFRISAGCVLGAELGVILFFMTRARRLAGRSWPVLTAVFFCLAAILLSWVVVPVGLEHLVFGPMLTLYVLAIVGALAPAPQRSLTPVANAPNSLASDRCKREAPYTQN